MSKDENKCSDFLLYSLKCDEKWEQKSTSSIQDVKSILNGTNLLLCGCFTQDLYQFSLFQVVRL